MKNHSGLKRKNAARFIVRMFFSLFAQGIIFFSAAGTLEIARAWLFFTITFFYYLISTIILFKVTPTLVNQRGGSAFKDNTPTWDKVILLTYTILGLYIQIFIAGWNVGRLHWWPMGMESLIIGLALYLISIIIIMWAMIKNPFFEPSARVQDDQNQEVVKTGPYKFIRHPGYLSGILWHVAVPLIIGSSLALLFSLSVIILLLIRTYLEDCLLKEELEGYYLYSQQVKYRLLPGLW